MELTIELNAILAKIESNYDYCEDLQSIVNYQFNITFIPQNKMDALLLPHQLINKYLSLFANQKVNIKMRMILSCRNN